MSFCRITNLMETSIIIEDLGVRLASRGSTSLVDASAAARSRDLKRYQRWVRMEPVMPPRLAIWPFTKPVNPPKQIISVPVAPSHELKQMQEALKTLSEQTQKLSECIIQVAQLKGVTPPPVLLASDVFAIEKDPIFIPSQIMPKDANVQIQAHEGETDQHSVDAATHALKNLKRRKS